MVAKLRGPALSLLLVLAAFTVAAWSGGWFATRPPGSPAAAAVISDDAGDEIATTTFDGPMVRKRAALAVHPAKGADRAHIAAELRTAATAAGIGELTDATFAVFSADLLRYLVPEVTLVLPEGITVQRAEAFMRDHQPDDVAFYVAQTVLVHDVTFAVVTGGVAPAEAQRREDAEGILSDSLNHYVTTVQPAGLTVRYFGALLSDGQIGAVRTAMARAAGTTADRVSVAASEPGAGVDLSGGLPDLDAQAEHHGH
ncbi:hypothetical protein ACWT_7245 [Actinoplanes sp. SE50]|uniref:hypothetical protein n=1 Tax=unclassified Actinoplanes TaxID=2626549 RepID=UPI00023EDF0E|nr:MULTISPECIES: hypothetical protein [unclassified Actinoplanes]AEV88255.1 hypothetical protein ACPL_7375 [Actinoplanes sp. SE50/110]ATO86660.1 hypothetical protein ACWT_7245 [Actinoplanes sp. SE50]SLM04078.1 hypothetical protein ACSP50_7380 [Actinoplanes sp. SE50/110]